MLLGARETELSQALQQQHALQARLTDLQLSLKRQLGANEEQTQANLQSLLLDFVDYCSQATGIGVNKFL